MNRTVQGQRNDRAAYVLSFSPQGVLSILCLRFLCLQLHDTLISVIRSMWAHSTTSTTFARLDTRNTACFQAERKERYLMDKIRGFLVTIVLLTTLGGLVLSEAGSSLAANAPSGLHTTISSLAGAEGGQFKLAAICPGGGADDC
jgi:hypothetical protein